MGHNRAMNGAENTAWRTFLSAHDRVLARLDGDLAAECDMTLAEYEVLLHLAEAPDRRLRMNELAELARLSPSGLTRRFDALVRRGWVTRERCDDDRRGVVAQLTRQGLERQAAAAPVHLRGARTYFLDGLDHDQVVALGSMMERVLEANSEAPTALSRA